MIAEAVDAYGCAVWEVVPTADMDLASNPPRGELFVVTDWQSDPRNICDVYDLPIGSVVGGVVVSGMPDVVEDIQTDSRVRADWSFFERGKIRSFACVPIPLQRLDSAPAALVVYSQSVRRFDRGEVQLLQELSTLLDGLYGAIRDRVSSILLNRVHEKLRDAEATSLEEPLEETAFKQSLHDVSQIIAETFECIETSIYLEDRFTQPGELRLAATTHEPYTRKQAYVPEDSGLTMWVYRNARSIKLFDLANFHRDSPAIEAEYPGLNWIDDVKVESRAREALGLQPDEMLPPITFMACPVFVAGEVRGVVRCCTAKEGPFYFHNREVNLLELVAAQIGGYWGNQLAKRLANRDQQSWEDFVEGLSQLNQHVRARLATTDLKADQIFEEGLDVALKALPTSDKLDVRVYDAKNKEFYFNNVRGKLWMEGFPGLIAKARQVRFPAVGDDPRSAAAWVHRSRDVYEVVDVEQDNYYKELFPEIRGEILAPIFSEKNFYGVLTASRASKALFPRPAKYILKLLGRQLGLYLYLNETVQNLQAATRDLEQVRVKEAQTYQDLGHQLKSPIMQARNRLRAEQRGRMPQDKRESNRRATRGLVAKAHRVVTNVRFFAALAVGGPIPRSVSSVAMSDLTRILIEQASDALAVVYPRGIDFHIFEKDFASLHNLEVRADVKLLEQALSNIFDNAGKYSKKGTTVEVFGDLAQDSQTLEITISNEGITLDREELKHLGSRGWRGKRARRASGEGSGIGLWIVSEILKAHDRQLQIEPTDQDGITRFTLPFPCRQREGERV